MVRLRPAAGVRRRARKDAGRLRKAFLATALLVAAAPISGSFAGARSGGADSPLSTADESCPRGTRSLPGDALAGATRAALREAPHLYSGVDTRDRRATIAALATVDGARGRQVRRECGPRVQRRTVVVMPEALRAAQRVAILSEVLGRELPSNRSRTRTRGSR